MSGGHTNAASRTLGFGILSHHGKFSTHGAVPIGPEHQAELPPSLTALISVPPAAPPGVLLWLRLRLAS